jgi:NagD protein
MGLETGLATILVLTGVTRPDMIGNFPYRPDRVVNSVADIEF